jgi:predicted  nucleic acid-binding Zn-ribbon protein
MKRISLHKVMAKLAEEQTPEMVQLNAIDNLRKKLNKSLTNFDGSVSKVRNIANDFVDLEGDFDKISNEAKSIQKALADFGVDDSDVRSIASEAERLKGLSNQFVKTLR